MHPARAIAALREAAPADALMVSDSGANTYYTGHNWTSHGPGEYFLLSTTGPMGYAIAMAIGVQMARPERQVIAVMGDGDMGMHGMEYLTAVRFKVPLLIVILDNHALGNVYLALKRNDMGRAAEKLTDIPGRDWPLFAKAMGGDGEMVEHPGELDRAFKRGLESKLPYIVQVRVDKNAPTPNTQESDIPGPPRCR
jgi:thiamine pyrophosphate-dependent acetolactate synthase large subunit-like protein